MERQIDQRLKIREILISQVARLAHNSTLEFLTKLDMHGLS
jgi:hypothetical protein